MGLFGFGDGKMELQLKNLNLYPGGMLEGTASITLKKDVKGKGVIATLFAESIAWQRNMQGREEKRIMVVYKKEDILDVEKTYLKQGSPLQYQFRFDIPQNVLAPEMRSVVKGIENLAGGASSFGMGRGFAGVVRWYVEVKLEMPLAIGISKKLELNVSPSNMPTSAPNTKS
jgi:hypothetical protein